MKLGQVKGTAINWQAYEFLANSNPAYVEGLYVEYRRDPKNVEEAWRIFFAGFDLQRHVTEQEEALVALKKKGGADSAEKNIGTTDARSTGGADTRRSTTGGLGASSSSLPAMGMGNQDTKERSVIKLIHAYRTRGFAIAKLNPLEDHKDDREKKDWQLSYFGLDKNDLDRTFDSGKELQIGRATLREILTCLKSVYTGAMGVEFGHCKDSKLRHWIYDQLEPSYGSPNYGEEEKLNIFAYLMRGVIFENFLQKKYIGQKRFGLEGGEALIPALEGLISKGADLGVEEFVFGMAHRGRLSVLVNILQKSYDQLFMEFEGGLLPDHIKGDGDVKYHLGQSADIEKNGKKVHLSLAFNPSHLEAVDPIVCGMVQAKCLKYYGENKQKIVPVLIHGDAAVTGQGVIYELANMSQLDGYNNGGTVHIVIDNQLGFTATSAETRSSLYATDIAYITDSPVFHVNGDDPVKVTYAFELAILMRQKFKIDVWVNIICYRRRGHNESDDPTFTSPLMYERINKHKNVLEIYKEMLSRENILGEKQFRETYEIFEKDLDLKLSEAREVKAPIHVDSLKRYWQDIREATEEDVQQSVTTAVARPQLDMLARGITTSPADFNLHRKIKRMLEGKWDRYHDLGKIDWAMGEALAYASLLSEKRSIRLAGQDSGRGTFSHRHAILYDTKTEEKYIPLSSCEEGKAKFYILNTQLSEYSVLGFEYGYSLARPHALVIWEAQFGDFANCAQVIIDQFITSGESKWQRHSGIVLLLPHGYEGMGPEHSSARLERFLQMCARNNMYVVNVTTPANFFHLMRRAIHSPFRKPTIVMSPKSLIRHPRVLSPIEAFTDPKRGRFQELLDDEEVVAQNVRRVLLSSGKIYYELLAEREQANIKNIALVRLEQLYPLVTSKLADLKKRYAHAIDWVWVQEEPQNMGAWSHLLLNLPNFGLRCIARRFSSSPASGIKAVHERNQKLIIETAIHAPLAKEASPRADVKKQKSRKQMGANVITIGGDVTGGDGALSRLGDRKPEILGKKRSREKKKQKQ